MIARLRITAILRITSETYLSSPRASAMQPCSWWASSCGGLRDRAGQFSGVVGLKRESAPLRRAADEVPLGQVAAQIAQEIERLDVFDTFGDHSQTHVVAEVDCGSHELHL